MIQTMWNRLLRSSIAISAAAFTFFTWTASAHEASPVQADFVPPAPGTYQLERIQKAPNGTLLNTQSQRVQLEALTRGKITLLALMYTSCSDAKGCPLSFHTLHLVRKELAKFREAKNHVQLVSLSFDPARDTPDVMRKYAADQSARLTGIPWHFLTAPSSSEIAPIIDEFGQDVSVPSDPQAAKAASELSHVLKVFLIDREGWVREIYTTAFLVPKVIVNDVQTLLREPAKLAAHTKNRQ